MADMRMKLDYRGFKGLRKSVDDELMRRAQRVVAAAGPGFKAEHAPSRNRARVVVYPDTPEAIRRNGEDLLLLKVMGAAR